MKGLSKQLKDLRRRSGLSLSELAARVNTSASTLSRYESGWERFELYTLNKIATALGCRLNVEFKPIEMAVAPKGMAGCLKKIRRLFWERRLQGGDFRKYPQWIVERVIEFGSLDDVHSLMNVMGRRMFLKNVANSRFQSPKTRIFWSNILKREGVKCTKRFFPREANFY